MFDIFDILYRRVKAKHLKKRADALFSEGNWGKASKAYADAIEACPRGDADVLRSLYSNISLACSKCARYSEAKEYADSAIEVSGGQWSKGFWRRGQALLGLHRAEDAVDDFAMAWKLEKSNECKVKLRGVIQSLPKEMLAWKMMQAVGEVVGTESPIVERVDDAVLQEGAYILLKNIAKREEHFMQRQSCYDVYFDWKTGCGPSRMEALIFRSHVYTSSKAYLQARADAAVALHMLQSEVKGRENELVMVALVIAAYKALGKGLLAESDHPDRDPSEALKAFTKALHCGCKDQDVYDAVQEATESLTKEEVDDAMNAVFLEGNIMDAATRSQQVSTKLNVCMRFPHADRKSMSPHIRETLRNVISRIGGTALQKVSIEKVSCAGSPSRICVMLQADVPEVNPSLDAMKQELLSIWMVEKEDSIDEGIATLRSQLGNLDEGCIDISCVDTHDKAPTMSTPSPVEETAMIEAVRPKRDLALPYKEYKLVDACGNHVARTEKHAFCMSRVYYDRSEIQNETWVEMGDDSCRWRQSGSEIKVIVLKVPRDLPPKHLEVIFEPYKLSVQNKVTGEVYLAGQLYRGIIPDECFWTHIGGEGEDACCLTMTKMNLEVLKSHWKHSEMWWSKLFENHPDIAWDDYEKDYSDLPEEVLERHRIREAQKDEVKQIESKDEKRRKRLSQADDKRKKNRMLELQRLRDGTN